MTQRIRVPDLLSGPFTGVIIGTYGADLTFAEREVFRQLNPTTRARVILADARQVSQGLASGTVEARRANRTYVAASVRSPHAWHPKFIMLTGQEAGRLLVGSGNLSVSGYTGPGECFTVYDWSPVNDDARVEFATVVDVLRKIGDLGWIDSVATQRIDDILTAAPWTIQPAAVETGSVRHNLNRSHLDQLIDAVAGRNVDQIIAGAPFHDRGTKAMAELLDTFSPDRLTLVVQDANTVLNTETAADVLEKSKATVEIVASEAPDPYFPTYLHAKFIIVKTSDQDILLQGSPNLSTIALTKAGDEANFELANLLTGPPGSFDTLVATLDRTTLESLDSFQAHEVGDDDGSEAWPAHPAIHTVIWSAPDLSCILEESETAPAILVRVGDRTLTAEKSEEKTAHDRLRIILTFSPEDSLLIENAALVELILDADDSILVLPYHMNTLRNVSATGRRTDLLTHTGSLDLDDAELSELIAELERVLVVDPRGLWRVANPTSEVPDDSDSQPSIRYDEIDWDAVSAHPTMRMYRSAFSRESIAETELGIALRALTDRFRTDVAMALNPQQVNTREHDDLAWEQGSEDGEELDGMAGQTPVRRQSDSARERRLWRNFVRRFLSGISSEDFVESVGPTVILPSYVVFEHLCRRLRILKRIDPDFLFEAQLSMWQFLWGTYPGGGYIESLPSQEQAVAREFLRENDHLPAFIAAVDDVIGEGFRSAQDAGRLRDAWHGFLLSSSWEPTQHTLSHAAAASHWHSRGPDVAGLVEDLETLTMFIAEAEFDERIAEAAGVPQSAITWTEETIVQSGVERRVTQITTIGDSSQLTYDGAVAALSVWEDVQPGLDYYRISASNALAFRDRDTGEGFYYDRFEHKLVDLPSHLAAADAPWELRWAEFLEATDAVLVLNG